MLLIVPVDVPPDLENTMAAPPVVIVLPAASRACNVRVVADPDCIVEVPTEMTEVFLEIDPGVTVIVGNAVETAEPLIDAEIVAAVPTRTPVKVAVYVPFPLSVTELKVPVDVPEAIENVTVAPPVGRSFPSASFACKVTVLELPEATVAPETVTTEVTGEGGG